MGPEVNLKLTIEAGEWPFERYLWLQVPS